MENNKKKYVCDYAELMSEWNFEKNNVLGYDPKKMTYGSAKKVWWKCEKGHEWEAAINSRNSGVGCPVCSGHKIVVGINDLATISPDIAAQWHPTKNGDLKPTDVTVGNGKKVWWQCEKGHEWRTAVAHRSKGTNCPICSGKKVLAGYNDLATLNPSLASEWHPTKNEKLTAQDVTVNSNKKVWWQCKKGHEWQAVVNHRYRGTKCPKCYGEIKTSFPEQAMLFYFSQATTACSRYMVDNKNEIDIYLPEYKIGIEYDGIYYHKGEKAEKREKRKQEILDNIGIRLFRVKEFKGEHVSNPPKNVIYSKPGPTDNELTETIKKLFAYINSVTGLSLTADVDVARDRKEIYEQYIEGEKARSLLAVNPKVAAEWHPTKNGKLLPEYFAVSSNKKVWWQCEKGHEWQAVINSRRNGGGCPYCAGKKAIVGYNDFATVKPKLATEWHPTKNGSLKPTDVTIGSNKKVWWRCEKGHEWKTAICDRTNGGRNCPVCSGHKVLVGYNDLATLNPSLASEWHPTKNGGLKASDVTCGSDKRVWWQCSKGHEWEAVVSSRKFGYGCPCCAGQKVIAGYNDLLTINPSLASEWHPTKNGDLKPTDVMPSSNKKAWWLGKCGHEWEAVIGSRNSGNGCPYCASQKVLAGFNDLATINPKLAAEWHPTKNGDLQPNNVMPGSNKNIWWFGKCRHEWVASVNSRNMGRNCPYCSSEKVFKGYNDLVTKNTSLAAEWHPTKNGDLKPTDVMPFTNKKAWWLGKCGHEWSASIASRSVGRGCPYCANKKTLAGYNDLATLKPELAEEWHPTKNGDLLPNAVACGSNKKVWWKCKKGHEWEATPNHRSRGQTCPYCAREKKRRTTDH